MLAINSSKFSVPVRMKSADGDTVWKLISDIGIGLDYMVAYTFNYTWTYGEWRATFHYEGGSVKPSPRTLRVYGAEVLEDVVLALATNQDECFDFDFTILYSDPRSHVFKLRRDSRAVNS